jgi:hypothetical protein
MEEMSLVLPEPTSNFSRLPGLVLPEPTSYFSRLPGIERGKRGIQIQRGGEGKRRTKNLLTNTMTAKLEKLQSRKEGDGVRM